ncbi:MAG: hypothetical protein QNJ31_01865 [Candidatus Caenarcaniphilales bacterium]|nr:hypothetical protein [Candidatus Caenarcaniphilales bacterium]
MASDHAKVAAEVKAFYHKYSIPQDERRILAEAYIQKIEKNGLAKEAVSFEVIKEALVDIVFGEKSLMNGDISVGNLKTYISRRQILAILGSIKTDKQNAFPQLSTLLNRSLINDFYRKELKCNFPSLEPLTCLVANGSWDGLVGLYIVDNQAQILTDSNVEKNIGSIIKKQIRTEKSKNIRDQIMQTTSQWFQLLFPYSTQEERIHLKNTHKILLITY